jgi:hypothetical protein
LNSKKQSIRVVMVEKRAALRFPTDLVASCRAPDHAWASRLCNISTSGCMITLPDGELSNEAPLRLRIKGLAAIDAEVVWQHRSHAGVRFRVPLHPAAMEHLGFALPEGAWESAYRTAQQGSVPTPRRAVATPSRRAASAGLNGQLVKRIEPASELHG